MVKQLYTSILVPQGAPTFTRKPQILQKTSDSGDPAIVFDIGFQADQNPEVSLEATSLQPVSVQISVLFKWKKVVFIKVFFTGHLVESERQEDEGIKSN